MAESKLTEAVINHHSGMAAQGDCRLCRGSNLFILDVMQVTAARQRWQWAELGAGANYCPCSWPEAVQLQGGSEQ